jgi:hypothetical protein
MLPLLDPTSPEYKKMIETADRIKELDYVRIKPTTMARAGMS